MKSSHKTVVLDRGLGTKEALSLVVGTIIGTGVFLKTATMTQAVGSMVWVIAAWAAAGLLSMIGAFTYAELGAMYPEAGGEYVYLKKGWGPFWGFLYGWQRFWIGSPGSIAAYAVGAATFLEGAIGNHGALARTSLAVGFITLFTSLNCLSVVFGGRLQTFLTALKFLMILGLTAGIFAFSNGAAHSPDVLSAAPTLSRFGVAMLAALWAFDGWNNLPMAAGEIREPGVTLPRALIVGTLLVFGVYAVANLSYFHAVSIDEILSANSSKFPQAYPVATKAAMTFMGSASVVVLSVAFVISALGAMNGSILTGARVPYAMAQDGLFFSGLSRLSEKTHVPILSVITQGIWSSILAISGSFDQLTDMVVFSSWLFYALCAAAVVRLRYRSPDAIRPFKTPGFPLLPILFCLVASWLLINTVIEMPKESGVGLLLISLGIPFYLFLRKKKLER